MLGPRTANTREVLCTHCGAANAVAQRAMSIFCLHCHKRLILEDYVIKSYQALKSYVTCGDIVVEKSGRVHATIQANDLTVHGVVEGDVRVRGRLDIAASGSVSGAVKAPAIRVADGAKLVAYCEIRPAPAAVKPSVPAAPAPVAVAQRKATAVQAIVPLVAKLEAPAAPKPAMKTAAAVEPVEAAPIAAKPLKAGRKPKASSAEKPAKPAEPDPPAIAKSTTRSKPAEPQVKPAARPKPDEPIKSISTRRKRTTKPGE